MNEQETYRKALEKFVKTFEDMDFRPDKTVFDTYLKWRGLAPEEYLAERVEPLADVVIHDLL